MKPVSHEKISGSLPENGLFKGKTWLLSPEPLALEDEALGGLEELGTLLHSFLVAANALYFDPRTPSWVVRTLNLGKPDEIIALGAAPAFRDSVPGVIRPDVLMTAEGLKVTEIDSLPGGIGLTAWLNQVYASSGWPVIGDASGMVDAFSELLAGGNVVISREAQDYRPEMEWIIGQMADTESRIVDTWDFDPETDSSATAYRYFEMWDFENVENIERLVALAKSGAVAFTPPMKAFLEEKLWLSLLFTPGLRELWHDIFGAENHARMREFTPEGWILDPAPIPHFAEYAGLGIQDWNGLKRLSQKERRLVAKISGFSEKAWGSRGVWIGHDLPGVEWSRVVEDSLAAFAEQPHVLQRFNEAKVIEHPFFDPGSGAIRIMRGRVRLCPFYFVERGSVAMRGVLATICPEDKKLIHGMSEAILVPCVPRSRVDRRD